MERVLAALNQAEYALLRSYQPYWVIDGLADARRIITSATSGPGRTAT